MINPKELLNKKNIFAVVGASDNTDKYGYKVYKNLKLRAGTVYPVNPNRDTIQGDTAYPSLAELPERPNVVSVIVPAETGRKVLQQAMDMKIETIWFQPGAEDQYIVSMANSTDNINIIHGQCILTAMGVIHNEIR